ncbi:transporter substrate-binding domain-containing protein [Neptuniibacter sp. CAU 1671]|uniref:substrate-binding periplasmic protein n=1 Tax=Neptuniibacter sp. CAU 1671 TaxID=3032593 RepID=UPI0023DB8041|nr:transporter substrate-binding domain-containing protein [Neptuniibacter sp. CAU 1671]MDF2181947.1 transporter substrate-binding domain-containing protein [Neptuniibacter sp. CAU 1671]
MRCRVGRNAIAALMFLVSTGLMADTLQEIKSSGELEVCVNPFQPPFSVRMPEVGGMQIDLARELASTLGVSLKISWIVQKRDARKTGCDLYTGVARLGDGESKYLRITQPYLNLEFKLVMSADSDPVNGLADLQQRHSVIGVNAGSVASHALHHADIPIAVRFNDEQSRLQAVVDGKINGAVVTNVTLGYFQQQGHQFKVYDAEALLNEKLNYAYAMGLRKADDATEARFNEMLKTLKQNGRLNTVLKPYGVSAL